MNCVAAAKSSRTRLLAHLAPVGWQHINLTGDYLWDADAGLAPDGLPAASHDSNQSSPGSRRLTLIPFPIRSCLACYPARSMA